MGVGGGHLPQLAVRDDLVDAHARLAALGAGGGAAGAIEQRLAGVSSKYAVSSE